MTAGGGPAQKALGRFSLFLAPSIFQVALSFLMLPLATLVVGPHEYGVFALASAYTAFGSAIATMGGSYVIAHRFPGSSEAEARELISTITLLGMAAVAAYGVLLIAAWPMLPGAENIPIGCLILAVVAMVASQPWVVAIDVITIRGDARSFAIMSVAQSILSAIALAAALFVLDLRVGALFVSQVTSAAVALVGGMYLLRRYFHSRINPAVLRELRAIGLLSALGNVAEATQVAVERGLLSRHAGVSQLGLYSHSQQYRGFVSLPVKALARSIWPTTLRDAREDSSAFARTREAWDLVFVGLTLFGLFFSTVGDWAIGLLTNGKFSAAYQIAAFWMAYLILQNAGKPQTGVLYALGGGASYARLVVASAGVGILSLFALVPVFGVWGALAGVTLQQVFLRAGVQLSARAVRHSPFQDGWAYFGIAYIAAVFAIRRYAQWSLGGNLLLLTVSSAVLVLIARHPLLAAWRRGFGVSVGIPRAAEP